MAKNPFRQAERALSPPKKKPAPKAKTIPLSELQKPTTSRQAAVNAALRANTKGRSSTNKGRKR
jgi:hypothetical protein